MSNILSKRKTILMRKSDHHWDFLLERGSRLETPSPCQCSGTQDLVWINDPLHRFNPSPFGMTVHVKSMEYTHINKERSIVHLGRTQYPHHYTYPHMTYILTRRCVPYTHHRERHYRIVTGGFTVRETCFTSPVSVLPPSGTCNYITLDPSHLFI